MKNTKYSSTQHPQTTGETIQQKLHKDDVAHRIGDIIERAGEKVKDAGAEKLGNSIYRAGNKVEHMNDKK